jgi:protocatechuate 3,4-dioxygenase, beta subunit
MSRCPFPLLAAFVLVTTVGCAAGAREPMHPCAWCGAMDAPPDDQLTWWMQIAGDDEPGQRIVLRGRVFMPDGETPAPDVLVYAYHTDATGVYRMEGDETGNGRRHGALRGWLRTDSEGRYEIRTIKPEAYPTRSEPAHVHVTLTPRGGEERWVDTYWFEGDPLITDRARRVLRDTGRFAGIVRLEADDDGVLAAERDLLLRQ